MIELKDYEYPCPHCNGLKYVGPFRNVCGKCMGSGKLDWIENIVGKKINIDARYDEVSKEIVNLINNVHKVPIINEVQSMPFQIDLKMQQPEKILEEYYEEKK